MRGTRAALLAAAWSAPAQARGLCVRATQPYQQQLSFRGSPHEGAGASGGAWSLAKGSVNPRLNTAPSGAARQLRLVGGIGNACGGPKQPLLLSKAPRSAACRRCQRRFSTRAAPPLLRPPCAGATAQRKLPLAPRTCCKAAWAAALPDRAPPSSSRLLASVSPTSDTPLHSTNTLQLLTHA